MKQPVVVLENGASKIKVGVVNASTSVASQDLQRVFPNAIIKSKGDKRTFYGADFEECKDCSGLNYRLPFEKGYLTDWDAQKAIWDGVLRHEFLGIDPHEASVLVTEPYFNLPNIQDTYDQFMFEEYEFAAYYRSTPAAFLPHGQLFKVRGLPSPECILVVDAGFSFTHVVPLINGVIEWSAVKRIDVGGKLLTNHLKELVSYRQWNMMDETHVMNDVKESCCYVSQDFATDLETCRRNTRVNAIVREYILPDFSLNKRGRVRKPGEMLLDSHQILYMGNERFSIPEVLFHPSYLGLQQAGLAAAVAQSIALLPEELQDMFWANIGLVGGSVKFPGFAQRLMSELRPLAPSDQEVVIYESKDAVLEAYRSAVAFACSVRFRDCVVTREEYLESGPAACRVRFADWKGASDIGKGKGRARVDESDDESSQVTQTRTVKTRTRVVAGVKRR
ncbi:actin-related protein Arp6 [Vararia minispora EC-137]|uniref:Actin-related protein Arp6 n=1 Tax=Vararia minispora EC-137 TaxID=1314806 RepID=A0ACB8QDM9_9AGAM|nr:actin-related protein Arp6 [Vararia minispora EC-137]